VNSKVHSALKCVVHKIKHILTSLYQRSSHVLICAIIRWARGRELNLLTKAYQGVALKDVEPDWTGGFGCLGCHPAHCAIHIIGFPSLLK